MRRRGAFGLAAALFACAALAWLFWRHAWLAPEGALAWAHAGTTYVLRTPRLLAAALVAPLLVWMATRSLADLPWQQRVLSTLLRVGFVALLALALARAARTTSESRVATVYLVDVSDSVSDEALADARELVGKAMAGKKDGDRIELVTFARHPRREDLPEKGPPAIARHGERAAKQGAGTDLQAALQLAYGLYPPGWLRRAVILSDGVQTGGDLLAEAARAKDLGVRIFTVPYRRPPPGEVAIRKLTVPDRVKVGEPFDVRADVWSSRATRARARLFQGESLNGLDGVRAVDLSPGPNELVFPSVVRVSGEVTYALDLAPEGEDTFADNNRYAVTVDVPGRPTVLYVDGEPAHATPLASALERQGFDVDVRPPTSMPGSLGEMERYDFMVLSDVPAEQVSAGTQDLVESYVRQLGGGFLFAGGPSGYGPGGWGHTAMERLLPVRMDAERRRDMPSVAMVLVIDRSGSMGGTPIEMAKQAARATVGTLAPDDLIEVIAFDSQPTRFVKMQPARNRGRIESDIGRIQSGGGTEIFPALDAAYQDLGVTAARRKHVVLLTDGRASNSGIRDLVQAMAAESITVTTVGLGAEVDDQLLSMIKDVGGGRYHKVPDANSLPKVFTRETEIVAKSAATTDYFPVRQAGPAEFLRGLDVAGAPLLSGYTVTQTKPSPAQEILVNADTGDPILARWRVGLGWALAWTSDVKSRWASDWVRWGGWPQLWGQLAHEHMRQKHRRELDMKAEIVAGELRATVDAFDAEDRFENGLESTLSIVGPEPAKTSRSVPLRQTAPGRYEARVPLDAQGAFLLRADHRRRKDDGTLAPVAVSFGHVTHPYPPEYASFEPDRALLERVASVTGGATDPDLAAVVDPAGEHVTSHEDLWPRLVMAAIALLVLDLLLRRVRLFDRRFARAR